MTEISLNFLRNRPRDVYGVGFWSDRYRFLDYTGSRFLEVQEDLLKEQLAQLPSVPVAAQFAGTSNPQSVSEFLRSVPLTTIDDYASSLSELRESASGRSYTWAYTMYGAGKPKWVPFTQRAIKVLGENAIGAIAMAAGEGGRHGDVGPGSKVVYNVPPRPYLAGIAAFELARRFGLKGVIDHQDAEGMDFEERIREEFRVALAEGVDLFLSMTSVLRRISDRFSEDLAGDSSSSRDGIGFRAGMRYATAVAKTRLAGRKMKPGDLWSPKAILGWGLDTRYFREQLADDWGRPPFEVYVSTEGGIMGLQYREDSGVALNPEAGFFEFIPESEMEALRTDPKYTPKTVLLPDVEHGERYEMVMTSFYGMPFVRYRTGHMVRFNAGHLGYAPDMEQVGRADDHLDIGGFTRIDEATIWKAVSRIDLRINDWIVRREVTEGSPTLHMYAECQGPDSAEEVEAQVHRALMSNDPLYADLVGMLGWKPFRVTLLNAGTFSAFYEEMKKDGEELLARKPRRVNAPDTTVERLKQISERQREVRAA